LNLGKIIFAIDHLHDRCIEAATKMKQDGDKSILNKTQVKSKNMGAT